MPNKRKLAMTDLACALPVYTNEKIPKHTRLVALEDPAFQQACKLDQAQTKPEKNP